MIKVYQTMKKRGVQFGPCGTPDTNANIWE